MIKENPVNIEKDYIRYFARENNIGKIEYFCYCQGDFLGPRKSLDYIGRRISKRYDDDLQKVNTPISRFDLYLDKKNGHEVILRPLKSDEEERLISLLKDPNLD